MNSGFSVSQRGMLQISEREVTDKLLTTRELWKNETKVKNLYGPETGNVKNRVRRRTVNTVHSTTAVEIRRAGVEIMMAAVEIREIRMDGWCGNPGNPDGWWRLGCDPNTAGGFLRGFSSPGG